MDAIYSRNILKKLEKWVDRKEIFAITGPRQAGKTTVMRLLKERLLKRGISEKNIIFLPCDDFDVAEPFIRNPKVFVKSYAPENKERYYFFFDEYQYIDDGGRKLKLLYDSFPNIKFIISGSSSLELKDSVGKYLVGRVFYFPLYPFNFGEFLHTKDERLVRIYEERNKAVSDFLVKNNDFSFQEDIFLKELNLLLEEYMLFGGYPEVLKAPDVETKKIILKNIYETYLTKDILELLKIRDTMTFRTLVSLLGAQHGTMLHFESLTSDSKSYYREVKQFVSVLIETYILHLLFPFHKNLSTELKKNPKIYFIDTGLRNYIVKNFNTLSLREDRGTLAEGIVFTELFHLFEDAEIKYWRTIGKAEVDFIFSLGQQRIPIEVKYQSFKKPQIERSLRNFIAQYAPEQALVITKDYFGSITFEKTKIKFVPLCYL